MIRHKTTEMPPQMVKSLEGTRYKRQRQYLKCEGFVLENTFPNNIALMKNGDIVYCTSFREPIQPFDPFTVSGLRFSDKESVFTDPMDSADIGMFSVRPVRSSKIKNYSSDDLVSKCFIFPHPVEDDEDLEVDPIPQALIDILETSYDEFRRQFEIFKLTEIGIRHQSLNKWDVTSIEVPGRHKL